MYRTGILALVAALLACSTPTVPPGTVGDTSNWCDPNDDVATEGPCCGGTRSYACVQGLLACQCSPGSP